MSGKVEHVLPLDGELITLGAEIGGIDLRRRSSVGCRKRDSGGKHVLGVADIHVTGKLETVSEKCHIDTEVVLDGCLPCQVVCYRGRYGGNGRFVATEKITLGTYGNRSEICIIAAHILVAELTVGVSELEVVEPALDWLEEVLFGNSPTE